MKFNRIEHQDEFPGDAIIFYVDLADLPQYHQEQAKMIAGEDYCDSAFGMCIGYDIKKNEFYISEDIDTSYPTPDHKCNIFYIDYNGDKHWMQADIPVELISQIFEACKKSINLHTFEPIRFIDSEYREIFRIPDGGSIRITYPPGDGREPVIRACKYIDEYHFNLSGNSEGKPSYGTTYHICEFAEAMERIGAKYEPLEQLLDAELHPFTDGEERFFNRNTDAGNTCIGLISAEFGRQGDRFQHNWTGIDESRNTSQFQKEIHRVIYALRQDLLKDNGAMEAYCKDYPAARLPGYAELEFYGFRLDTEVRQYFIRCMLGEDSRVAIFAYDKPEPTLSLDQHSEAAVEVIVAAEITPGRVEDHKMFFRNTEDNNHCIGYMRGDFGRGGNEFWHSWFEQDSTRKTLEFQSEFQDIVDKLRRDVLKDLKTSRSFCASHPDARLPDRDGVYYGFKLETESRSYFVRATTMSQDYFYIFAYDKPAPVIERDHVKEKPSVVQQLRDAKAVQKPPRQRKTPAKGKNGAEL